MNFFLYGNKLGRWLLKEKQHCMIQMKKATLFLILIYRNSKGCILCTKLNWWSFLSLLMSEPCIVLQPIISSDIFAIDYVLLERFLDSFQISSTLSRRDRLLHFPWNNKISIWEKACRLRYLLLTNIKSWISS